MELFFTVQFSMIWRLAKDHDFTQILTLWTFQRPKIENERSKMSIKYCDILSKSTKTIGRDWEEVFKLRNLLFFIAYHIRYVIEVDCHKKFHFLTFISKVFLDSFFLALLRSIVICEFGLGTIRKSIKFADKKKSKDGFWHVLLQEQFVLFTSVKVNLE